MFWRYLQCASAATGVCRAAELAGICLPSFLSFFVNSLMKWRKMLFKMLFSPSSDRNYWNSMWSRLWSWRKRWTKLLKKVEFWTIEQQACFRNPTKTHRGAPENSGAEKNPHYHQEIMAMPCWRMGTADTPQGRKSGPVTSVKKQHFRENPCAPWGDKGLHSCSRWRTQM